MKFAGAMLRLELSLFGTMEEQRLVATLSLQKHRNLHGSVVLLIFRFVCRNYCIYSVIARSAEEEGSKQGVFTNFSNIAGHNLLLFVTAQ